MSDYSLTASSALDGFHQEFDGAMIEEVIGLSIVSLSVPLQGEAAFKKALKAAYGIVPPKPGQSNLSKDGGTRLMNMSPDQYFALFDHDGDDGDILVAKAMGDAAYYTLQSDNWVALRLSGARAVDALRRICQLDLDGAFDVDAVGRTVMEHMGVILVREAKDCFLLLSAWSTAHSFLHALIRSVENLPVRP